MKINKSLGLLFALVIAFGAIQTSSAAVLSRSFGGGYTSYTIEVNPADDLLNVDFQYCDGYIGSHTPPSPTFTSFTHNSGGLTIAWIQTTWASNGTIIDYSGQCALGIGVSSPSGGGGGSLNYYKSQITDEEAGYAALTPPKNGSINYAAGTCAEKCSISPSIPTMSRNSLPGDAISTLYVRIAGEGGSYTTCFDVGELTDPVIYRYVAGAWVSQPATVGGGKVCTNASGDGAFALGGS